MKNKINRVLIFLLAFFSSHGQTFQWAKGVGGTFTDMGQAIKYDAMGNVYVAGTFSGTVDFDPGAGIVNLTSGGGTDFFILKLNATGNFIWARRIGGGGNDMTNTMTIDASGNVFTAGWFEGGVDFDPGAATYILTSLGMHDGFISKLDSSGNFVYAQKFGSVDQDEVNGLTIDGAGNLLVSGYYADTVDFNAGAATYNLASAGTYDIFILKLNSSGNFLWAKSMGGVNNDFPFSIATDASGNVFSAGYFLATADFDPGPAVYDLTPVSNFDSYILKLDAAGNFMWAKSVGGTAADESQAITVDANGNVIVAGYFYGTADFNPGAATYNLTSAGLADIFILQLDAAGNFSWAKRFGGSEMDNVFEITLDAAQNIYTCGYFKNTVDFDPGAATFNLSSAGGLDIFISKLDAAGNFLGAERTGGSGDDLASSMNMNAANTICMTGYFSGTVDFDPGAGTLNLTSAGDKDVFMIVPGNVATGIYETEGIINFSIYPNPSNDLITVNWKGVFEENSTITISDFTGKTIYSIAQLPKNQQQIQIDVRSLSNGFYLMTLRDENKKAASKFIINK